jgi:NTF2 fold immunity protein
MKLYRSDFETFPPTAQAVCAMIFLIALVSCNDRNIVSYSPQTSASIVATTPQSAPQAAPMMTPYPPNASYKPPKGYVPDAATAIKIAEAVWIPIYGKETLKDERPFTAQLVDGVWIVQGTMPKGMNGGTAYAEISKETGCILKVTHFQ